jgi:hypothetical protein
MKVSKLLLMAGLHFVAMYFLMYAMIDGLDHLYLNLNNSYMAALMTAPMLIIEIILMGEMYKNKKLLSYVFGGSIVVLVFAFLFIRQQTFIDNKRFLTSMIPHHSGAILMCEQSNITDPEIAELCDEIVETQEREIAIMEAQLEKLNTQQ